LASASERRRRSSSGPIHFALHPLYRPASSAGLTDDAPNALAGRQPPPDLRLDWCAGAPVWLLQRPILLAAESSALGATISFNWVMIATFFLTGLDISHQVIRWCRDQGLDWSRTMVFICGKQGPPTSGVMLATNSIAQIVLAASNHKLPADRLYIAPHGLTLGLLKPDDLEPVRAAEGELRALWSYTRAIAELSPTMFEGYPRYASSVYSPPPLTETTSELAEMPAIKGADDMRAMVTRLRLVQEDPRQLLSGCVTDHAAEQLRLNGNDPLAVVVPGLDGVVYRSTL
jgi:hypothetical protein